MDRITNSGNFKSEIHLHDYLVVLDRRKWVIIAVLIVTLSSTILYLKKQKPVYQSYTSILVEPKMSQGSIFPQSATFTNMEMKTKIEVIKTKPILASVVKKLELTKSSEGTPEFTEVLELLKENIEVDFVGETAIVNISVKHKIPQKSRDIANALAQTYIEYDRLSQLESGRDTVRWLTIQLTDLKKKLENSEEEFQVFKERESMISMDGMREEKLEEIYRINADYISTKSKRLEIQTIIDNIKSNNENELDIPIALLTNPTLQKLGIELNQLQTNLMEKRKLFKEKYPDILELKDKIQITQRKILDELINQQNFLKTQENLLADLQKSIHEETLKLSRKELEYLALEREVMTNREIYNTMLAKIKELSLAEGAPPKSIRVIEQAELPTNPVDNRIIKIILSGILGLILGVSLAFFMEYLENSIRTPDDVEQYLGLPVLGVVPQLMTENSNRIPPIVMQNNEANLHAEAYRSLRTNLMFSDVKEPVKTITVTSAGPKEGKSITSVNLAVALSQAGKNVILVDADLRRPTLHNVFKVDKYKGLSGVIIGDTSVEEAIQKTEIPGLNILPSGRISANSSELLGSNQMRLLISQLRGCYDVTLFDSAPILGMADTPVLAAETDATVIVIKTGKTNRKTLKFILGQLDRVSANICGVVLNNVDVRFDRYYDYYHYYYYLPYKDEGQVDVNSGNLYKG
jgi:capsular exopolysaccharide synthesis family protein